LFVGASIGVTCRSAEAILFETVGFGGARREDL
jgi:hypothetical protein